jgi:hypothetical protein
MFHVTSFDYLPITLQTIEFRFIHCYLSMMAVLWGRGLDSLVAVLLWPMVECWSAIALHIYVPVPLMSSHLRVVYSMGWEYRRD